jgi:lantibiotic modifying enzyme
MSAEWRALVEESERRILDARNADGWWTQHVAGHDQVALGPVHGFVGNVHALGSGGAHEAKLLRESALWDREHANWPPSFSDSKRLLQWCHGAPGVLTTARSYLDEELVLAGAELIWSAGPLHSQNKGAGICHGTAGNGYALLAAFERTGDEMWLERARAFAVHALGQAASLPPRHSLFNGSIGVALFATDCLERRLRFPVLDDWIPVGRRA